MVQHNDMYSVAKNTVVKALREALSTDDIQGRTTGLEEAVKAALERFPLNSFSDEDRSALLTECAGEAKKIAERYHPKDTNFINQIGDVVKDYICSGYTAAWTTAFEREVQQDRIQASGRALDEKYWQSNMSTLEFQALQRDWGAELLQDFEAQERAARDARILKNEELLARREQKHQLVQDMKEKISLLRDTEVVFRGAELKDLMGNLFGAHREAMTAAVRAGAGEKVFSTINEIFADHMKTIRYEARQTREGPQNLGEIGIQASVEIEGTIRALGELHTDFSVIADTQKVMTNAAGLAGV